MTNMKELAGRVKGPATIGDINQFNRDCLTWVPAAIEVMEKMAKALEGCDYGGYGSQPSFNRDEVEEALAAYKELLNGS